MIPNLFKPDFYWGPPDRDERMRRKQFAPRSAIRSQPMRRVKEAYKKRTTRSEHENEIEKSKLFSDTQFFYSIGVTPDKLRTLIQRKEDLNDREGDALR